MTEEDKEGSIFGSRALSDRFGSSGRISFQDFHTKVPRTAELNTNTAFVPMRRRHELIEKAVFCLCPVSHWT